MTNKIVKKIILPSGIFSPMIRGGAEASSFDPLLGVSCSIFQKKKWREY
jgi:hypothetical protein